jgi:molecular chaperone GrpE
MSQSAESARTPDPESRSDEEWEDMGPDESNDPASGQPAGTLQAELAQWKDTALRARADLDNFRKRMAQESTDARRYANASLLEELLPVLDNFQFGLQAAEADAGAKNILIGLNMVAGQMQAFLRDQGVEEVAAVGRKFDPNLHEAVGQQASRDVAEGVIISQVRRGFKLRDRLLRPATVIVSTGPAATE